MRPVIVLLGAALLAVWGATAVAGPSDDPRLLPRAYFVALQAAPDANGGQPLTVDVVVSCDATVGAFLKTMTSTQWFAQRQALSHASGSLNVTSWEVSPGRSIPSSKALARKCAKAAVVFANYGTPGEHRLVLGRKSHVTVMLDRADLRLAD